MKNPVRADKRKYHYIYQITRTDGSGKFYIGMHSTDDLNDGYFGSGKLLWSSIRKHGKDKHAKQIIEFLSSREELKNRERQLVNEDLIDNPLCMNLQIGGFGGNFKKGYTWTEEAKAKMSARRRGQPGHAHTEETKAKIRASANACIADGRMKTWATSLTKEERANNITKGNKSRAKALYAYSPEDGSFVKEFPSYNETVAILGLNKGTLSMALKDKCVQCGDYLWSHNKLDNLGVTKTDVEARRIWANRPKSSKAIKQILPDGSVKNWPSVSAVIREHGGHHGLYEKAIQTGESLFHSTWAR